MERPRTQARERTWSVTKMRAGVQRRRWRGRRGRRAHLGGGGGGFLEPLGGIIVGRAGYIGVQPNWEDRGVVSEEIPSRGIGDGD